MSKKCGNTKYLQTSGHYKTILGKLSEILETDFRNTIPE